jgi:protein-S-isoprenylcysteine O-methyltransferase Ste14
MAKPRRQNDWTLKIVVACCVALFFLSPGFSRMLPAGTVVCGFGRVCVARLVLKWKFRSFSKFVLEG